MEDYKYIEEIIEDTESYRDSIATVDGQGKRVWLYPKQPSGFFYQKRKYLSYLLLIILFGMPLLKFNGRPFMLFNIPKSEFILFGIYFGPQDFHLFAIAMLIGMILIVLFTAVYGRLFCGWICPQTIFMEMVFRRIEYWIEGSNKQQIKLTNTPWNIDKTWKKILKHTLFILISLFIAHTFLAYIIGMDEVIQVISEPISQHWKGFIAMVIFTAVFYGVFAFMREQVCTTVCPYGRLQGVLLDENSLAVSYDFVRGEPRGRLKKQRKEVDTFIELETIQPQGDCVDCGLCVQVCPTGIDIRNGTQLECVNCTACIDACDEVMIKVKRPKGLIRIDSYNGIKYNKKSLWNSRIAAYTAVLVALVGLESFLFISRTQVETLFLRTPGMLYQATDDGYISNLYNYQLINKSEIEGSVSFSSKSIEGILFQPIGQDPEINPRSNTEGAVFIKIPKEKILSKKTNITIIIKTNDGKIIDESETSFFGPPKK